MRRGTFAFYLIMQSIGFFANTTLADDNLNQENIFGLSSDKDLEKHAKLSSLKLERIIKNGGVTKKGMACGSYEQIEALQKSNEGEAVLKPTSDECWPFEPNVEVKLIKCLNVSIDIDILLNKTVSELNMYNEIKYSDRNNVCEFQYGWLGRTIWMSIEDVDYR